MTTTATVTIFTKNADYPMIGANLNEYNSDYERFDFDGIIESAELGCRLEDVCMELNLTYEIQLGEDHEVHFRLSKDDLLKADFLLQKRVNTDIDPLLLAKWFDFMEPFGGNFYVDEDGVERRVADFYWFANDGNLRYHPITSPTRS